MTYLSDKKYRIVLKSLHMDYHYRAKSAIFCNYRISESEFASLVTDPLERDGKIEFICKTIIKNLISSCKYICWG